MISVWISFAEKKSKAIALVIYLVFFVCKYIPTVVSRNWKEGMADVAGSE